MEKSGPIAKQNIEDILALTPMQQGMFFHYLKAPASSRYVEQLTLRLSGEIKPGVIEAAWNTVIETNEMLRAVYRWEKVKNPVQMILKKHRISLDYHDLTGTAAHEKEKQLAKITARDRAETSDLRRVPFRVTLCRTAPNKAHMIVTNHHILYDGWSSGILLKEFFSAYNDLLEQREPRGITKTKFKDFLKWTRGRQNRKGQEMEAFWREYLLAGPDRETPALPAKIKKRKQKDIDHIDQYRFQLPRDLNHRLTSFAKRHKITLSSLLTGAWGLLLQKYNDVEDIIFDTTVSGRSAKVKGIEDMVGMFINTLPTRVQTLAGETIVDFLVRLHAASQQREEYENTPLGDVNEYLEASRAGTETLFDSVLILENYPLDKQLMQEKGKLSVDSFSIAGMTQYDLTVIITTFDDIEVNITYNKDLFDKEILSRLSGHFTVLLEEMVSDLGKRASGIDVSPFAEQKKLRERLAALEKAEPGEGPGYIAPRDAVEEKLAGVWSEVLRIANIGIEDNFFDFGGHSLKATLLAARIHQTFEIKIPLEEIFKRPTIARLAQYIKETSGEQHEAYEPIPAAEEKGYYVLSSVQQRMYALQQLDPASTAYNVSSVMEVEGKVDNAVIEMFQKAFRQLIQRHEVLRTSFHQVNGEPMQKIHQHAAFEIEYAGSEPDTNALPASAVRDFVRSFDLSHAPLMRAKLVKIAETRHLLILDMHHIITDGFSMDTFIREFGALCRGEVLPGVKKHYKDFSEWQYFGLQSGRQEAREAFWLNELSGELPVLNLLTDFPRPLVQRFEGDRVHFVLDKEITFRLNQLARQRGVTLFMVLLAAFNVLLYRYTGQSDIIIGTTVAGRDHPELESIIGLFIETLAIRNQPTGDKTFAGFLQEVRARTLAAYENETYPFRELIRKMADAGDRSRNPLFDVMLIVQNVDMVELELEGLRFIPYPYYSEVSKLDMTLEAVESGGEIKFHIEYSTALFKPETMERMAGHYVNILTKVSANPDLRVSEIDILSPGERRRILEDFKGSHWEPEPGTYPEVKRIEEIFERQVADTPDNIAVVYEDQHLTYRQLDEKANIISKIIKEL